MSTNWLLLGGLGSCSKKKEWAVMGDLGQSWLTLVLLLEKALTPKFCMLCIFILNKYTFQPFMCSYLGSDMNLPKYTQLQILQQH